MYYKPVDDSAHHVVHVHLYAEQVCALTMSLWPLVLCGNHVTRGVGCNHAMRLARN